MKRAARLLSLATVLSFAIGNSVWAAANADYNEGQKLYSARNYRAAAAKFETAMRAAPRDPNVIYYCALANQMSSNRTRARQLYEYIISGFPGSQVAGMASTALQQLGGAAPMSGSTAYGGSTSASSGGSERHGQSSGSMNGIQSTDSFSIPFQRGRNGSGVYVDGSINGQGIKFHLDTGAASTVVGANQMEAMGLGRAAAGQKFEITGVGDRTKVEGWNQAVTLRIGQAQCRDFPISVQDHMEGDPLLGQDFLHNFDCEIDPEKMEVVFHKKGSRRGGVAVQPRGTIDIPFRNGPGGHIIVVAQINGKNCEMYFDTGADSVCLGMKHLKALGLSIPENARQGLSHGVAGDTITWSFPIDKMKLGKLEKEDFTISVAESTKMDYPLLGQSFFGDYKHKVDPEAHVVHFYPNN